MKKRENSSNNKTSRNESRGGDKGKTPRSKSAGFDKYSDKKPSKSFDRKDAKSYGDKKESYSKRPYNKSVLNKSDAGEKKKVQYLDAETLDYSSKIGTPSFKNTNSSKTENIQVFDNTEIRLNKFIANAGVCSRREADELIKMGLITVNGAEITDFGFKVKPSDRVKYNDRLLNAESKVYILLNKPKGYITTTSDPDERETVVDIVASATPFRVYPVGRLDRNTTGVLLLTNDGDFMEKITHPKFNIHKVYKVSLENKATLAEMEQLLEGVILEDGLAKADAIAFLDETKTNIGIEIHSGKNRIVRRMFEHLKHEVKRLDRTSFGPFTKTKLRVGEFRFLNEKELMMVERLKAQKAKTTSAAEKKTYGSKPFGDKKPGTDNRTYGGRKSFGDKSAAGDKKPYGDKKAYGEKKPYGEKKAYGDKKPFGDRKDVDGRRETKERRYPAPKRNANTNSAAKGTKKPDRKKR